MYAATHVTAGFQPGRTESNESAWRFQSICFECLCNRGRTEYERLYQPEPNVARPDEQRPAAETVAPPDERCGLLTNANDLELTPTLARAEIKKRVENT